MDIWARLKDGIAIIGEIKNRDNEPFTGPEAQTFLDKIATLQQLEQIADAIGFVYSRSSFTTPALTILREHHIAYSEDERWVE
ncbi:MAG: hypothetical protein GY801_37410 [bacterium]|nr:hypothetical protein [bacterium]